jgi:glycosyltransferase involved in cell wall biosynthesis
MGNPADTPWPETRPSPSVRPAVSVIVPCYGVTEYIAQALDSLRTQTFRDFEVLLVNDGCPDTPNLERVLAPYRDEIQYIKQENQGPSGARNTGIRAARAPLIANLDGDDFWAPEYLEKQVGYLQAHPEVDVVYPDAVFFGGTAWDGKRFMDMIPGVGEPTFRNILSGKCTVIYGATARRDAIMRAGLFDAEFRGAEDFDLWLRVARMGSKTACVREPLVYYRIRRGSLSNDRIAVQKCSIQVCEKLLQSGDLSKEDEQAIYDTLRVRRAGLDFVLGRKALYAGDTDEALERLRRANQFMDNRKLRAAIVLLRICPRLLFRLLHIRYPTEHEFLH